MRQLAANWLLVLRGVGMVMMTTVFFYLITAYTPTFGQKELKLTAVEAFLATLRGALHAALERGERIEIR